VISTLPPPGHVFADYDAILAAIREADQYIDPPSAPNTASHGPARSTNSTSASETASVWALFEALRLIDDGIRSVVGSRELWSVVRSGIPHDIDKRAPEPTAADEGAIDAIARTLTRAGWKRDSAYHELREMFGVRRRGGTSMYAEQALTHEPVHRLRPRIAHFSANTTELLEDFRYNLEHGTVSSQLLARVKLRIVRGLVILALILPPLDHYNVVTDFAEHISSQVSWAMRYVVSESSFQPPGPKPADDGPRPDTGPTTEPTTSAPETYQGREDGAVDTNDATWIVKVSGSYDLPWGFNVGAFFNYRTGYPTQRYFNTSTSLLNQGRQSVQVEKVGATRLPDIAMLDFRLSKVIVLGRFGKLEVMVDGFNLFNAYTTMGWNTQSSSTFHTITSILSPQIFRLGVKWAF